MSSRRLGGWICARVRTAAITIARMSADPDLRGGTQGLRCPVCPQIEGLDRRPTCAQRARSTAHLDAAKLLCQPNLGRSEGCRRLGPLGSAAPERPSGGSPRRCAQVPEDRGSCRFRFSRFAYGGVWSDVDAPAGHPGCQASILAFLADGQGELVVRHSHSSSARHRVHDHH